MEIYAIIVEALKKKERQPKTQFTTKIKVPTTLEC
jgi:hypothetical protein